MRRQRDQHSSMALYDLSDLVLNLLRSPPIPISFSDQFLDSPNPPSRFRPSQISPSGFASLLFGISVALMLCGSLTLFIGLLLMPWVFALFMVFYVAGIVSVISMVGKSVLFYVLAPPRSSGKDISGNFYDIEAKFVKVS